jgi:hypothetical protein
MAGTISFYFSLIIIGDIINNTQNLISFPKDGRNRFSQLRWSPVAGTGFTQGKEFIFYLELLSIGLSPSIQH